jgi:hypothetical protein
MLQKRYARFQDSDLWTDLSGKTIPRSADVIQAGAVLDLLGNPITDWDRGRARMSIVNPNWLKYHRDSMSYSLRNFSIRGFNWDFLSAGQFAAPGSDADYSQWAVAGYREHLRDSFSTEELRKMGIDDIGSFDFRSYRRDHAPNEAINESGEIADPILKYYYLWIHQKQLAFMQALEAHARELGEEANSFLPVFGNLFTGHSELSSTLWGFAQFMIARHNDIIQLESEPAVFTRDIPRVPNDENPRQNQRHSVNYRLGHAMADHEKPVWSLYMPFSPDRDRGVGDVTKRDFTNVIKLFVAEAYAHDVIPEMDLGGWPGSTYQHGTFFQDGSTIPEIVRYVRFVDEHRHLFTDVDTRARIGIILSFPTLMWNNHGVPDEPPAPAYKDQGFWGRPYFMYREAMVGYARALDHLQRFYDIVALGHPEFWDDSAILKRLERYSVLVLPLISHLSDAQAAAIKRWVATDDNRKLIVVGDPDVEIGTKDENDVRRSPWLAQLPNVSIVKTSDVQDYASRQQKMSSGIVNPLDGVTPLVELSGTGNPREVGVNITTVGGRTIVHLLNYDYDSEQDQFAEKTDFSLILDDNSVTQATFYGADRQLSTVLPINKRDGRVEVIVPSLATWSFVVFE